MNAERNLVLKVRKLGPYEVHELLGMGAMGAVYRGYQPNLKRYVAIKVLPRRFASEQGYVDRFTREAETIALLEHPHIVPIYDYGVKNGVSFIVMRLLTGGTLDERLQEQTRQKRAGASLSDAVNLLRDLASALDYAHSKGVIHRDLKPGNIIFDDSGNAYLSDFGIAKLLKTDHKITSTGLSVGTPVYMAPEQWLDEPVSPATDQYALGIILYLIVTGALPFDADTPFGLMKKHISDEPILPHTIRTDLPKTISHVLNRALAKEPSQRFPTVTAFAQAFEQASHDVVDKPTSYFLAIPDHRLDLTPEQQVQLEVDLDPTVILPNGSRAIIAASPVIRRKRPHRALLFLGGVIFVLVVAAAMLFFSGAIRSNSGGVKQASATPTATPTVHILRKTAIPATQVEQSTRSQAGSAPAQPTSAPAQPTSVPAQPTPRPAIIPTVPLPGLSVNQANAGQSPVQQAASLPQQVIPAVSNLVPTVLP